MAREIPWRRTLGAKLGGIAFFLVALALLLVLGNLYTLSAMIDRGLKKENGAFPSHKDAETTLKPLADLLLKWLEDLEKGINQYQEMLHEKVNYFQLFLYLFAGLVFLILGLVLWITRG